MASLFTFASLFLHLLCLNARCLRCHHQYCVALTFHVDKIFFPTGKELRGFWVLLGSIYDRTWDDIGGHRELQIATVFMWIRWNMRRHFRLQYESIEVQQFHKTVDPRPRDDSARVVVVAHAFGAPRWKQRIHRHDEQWYHHGMRRTLHFQMQRGWGQWSASHALSCETMPWGCKRLLPWLVWIWLG